jgi:pyridoxal phosphate enzyme (YggS family)
MIGHLQSNKVKYMAPFVDLIHGVDKFSTLKEINKQAKKNDRIINCLLQVKIAKEDTKFGFSFDEIVVVLSSEELAVLENIKIVGFMGMATFTDNQQQLQEEFLSLKTFFDTQQLKTVTKNCKLATLSMGMSGDYPLAIANGSTMVRVGSAIFGHRNYNL